MKKRYTFTYVKTVTGSVTVKEGDDREAQILAQEEIETLNEVEETSEMTFIDLKDVEPDGADRDGE